MAITHVVSTAKGATSSGSITTDAANTTGANLIVVSVSIYHPTGSAQTITDSAGNTWTALTQRALGNTRTRLYYCLNPTTSATHTFTCSGTTIYCTIAVSAFAGVDAYDQESGTALNTNGTSHQPGSLTPPEDNCLLVSSICSDGGASFNIDSSFNATTINYLAANHMGGGIAYLIQTTAAAVNPTWSWTTSSHRAAAMASFTAASAGGAGPRAHYYRQMQGAA